MTSSREFSKVYEDTQNVYIRQAEQFDKARARDGREQQWLQQFTETLPEGGHILDLGCGTGEPVAAWLMDRRFKITGVDYSEAMLKIARARFPNGTWLHQDMRDLDVSGPFDGIISWHGSFHLSPDEQRALIPQLAALLRPGGVLMLTIGPGEGEVTGTVGGETVYHSSLYPSEYEELLRKAGLTGIQLSNTDSTEGPFIVIAS